MTAKREQMPGLLRAAAGEQVRHIVPPMEECWSKIGVAGDRSCPELEGFIHCRNCPVLAEAARSFFDREPPEGYLETWSEILQTPEEETEADSVSMLIFRVAREWLSLPTTLLVEVTEMKPLHTIPHRRGGILEGLVNIRGQLQLCVSLKRLLGIDDSSTLPIPQDNLPPLIAEASARRLLVLEDGDERWVIAADEVAGVHAVPRSRLRSVPATVGQAGSRHAEALVDWKDTVVGFLDGERLLEHLRTELSA
jgi:chemotaxis-related protein WspD